MVTDSILELTCGIDPLTIGSIDIFASRLKASWDEANVTWNSPDDGDTWGLSGADDVPIVVHGSHHSTDMETTHSRSM